MFLISYIALIRGRIDIRFLYLSLGILLFLSIPTQVEEGIDASYYSELWNNYSSQGLDKLKVVLVDYASLKSTAVKDIGFHVYAWVMSHLGIGYNMGMAFWIMIMSSLIFDMFGSRSIGLGFISVYWVLVILGPHIFNGFRFWSACIFLLNPIVTGKRYWLLFLAPLFHIAFWVVMPLVYAIKKIGYSKAYYIVLVLLIVLTAWGMPDLTILSSMDNQGARFANVGARTSVVDNLSSSSGIGLTLWVGFRLSIAIAALSMLSSKNVLDRLFIFLTAVSLMMMFIESVGNRVLRMAMIVSLFTSLSPRMMLILYYSSAFAYILGLVAVYSEVDLLKFLL